MAGGSSPLGPVFQFGDAFIRNLFLSFIILLSIVSFIGFLGCENFKQEYTGQAPSPNPTPSPTPLSGYFVSPSGNDSNSGTFEAPWKTITKAANTLVSGETVYVRAGTYKERIIPKNSGATGKYITYEAYPGETVTIEGSGITVPSDEGLFDLSGKSYIRISGFKVVDSQYAGIFADGSSNLIIEKNYTYNSASSGIGIWGCSNIVISSNEVAMSGSNGWQESITVAGTNSFEVKNNLVHNELSGYDKEGICLKDGSSNGKVYGNTVHHIAAVGIYVDAWDKHTYNIDIYQNIARNGSTDGIAVASEMGGQLENVRIFNNIVYDNYFLGISIGVYGTAPSHPANNIQVVNNTTYNNGTSGWGGGISIGNPDARAIIIRNNICSQNVSFQIAGESVVPTGEATIDHNLIDGYRGDVADGETYGTSYVEGDPQFVNAAGADFHIKSTSPAIDKGSSTLAPNFDFDGTSRPQGSYYDIGAFEYK